MAKEFHKENISKSAPPPMPTVKYYGSGKNMATGSGGPKAGLAAKKGVGAVKKGR